MMAARVSIGFSGVQVVEVKLGPKDLQAVSKRESRHECDSLQLQALRFAQGDS